MIEQRGGCWCGSPGDSDGSLLLRTGVFRWHVRVVPRLLVPPSSRPARRSIRHRQNIVQLRSREDVPEHRGDLHSAPRRYVVPPPSRKLHVAITCQRRQMFFNLSNEFPSSSLPFNFNSFDCPAYVTVKKWHAQLIIRVTLETAEKTLSRICAIYCVNYPFKSAEIKIQRLHVHTFTCAHSHR